MGKRESRKKVKLVCRGALILEKKTFKLYKCTYYRSEGVKRYSGMVARRHRDEVNVHLTNEKIKRTRALFLNPFEFYNPD
jgi:hypothetical protein